MKNILWLYGSAEISSKQYYCISNAIKMDYNTLRMLELNEKLEKNKKLSSRLKVIAGGCLVLSFAYCAGSVIIEHLDKSEVKVTNFVWIVSIIALVVIYLKDMPALIVYILVTNSGFADALLLNELVCRISFLRRCVLGIKRYNRE